MLKTLKKYFIPHKENDHKPHILRNEATLVIIGLLVVMELVYLAGTGYPNYRSYFARIISGVLVDETNVSRNEQKLPSLTVSPVLELAAREKAEDMAKKGYFSHVGPDGKTPWQWLNEVSYNYSYAGENLAVNFIDSKDVVSAWMNSPGHKANILNGMYTEIGIGTATGTYKGKETVFIAQYFGKPLQNPVVNILPGINVAKASASTTIKQTPIQLVSTTIISNNELNKIVLGESVDIKPSSTEESHFIAIINPDAEIKNETPIINNDVKLVSQSTIIEKTLVSPHSVVNRFLILFGLIIITALGLKIFIKFEIQHPPLIINGFILITLIISALLLNKYIVIISAQVL